MHRVFVYGSLLAGEGNHRMMAGATPLGGAVLQPRYTLLDLGPYPALLEGGETAVQGELYEVSDSRLQALDRFERHPVLYARKPAWLGTGAEVFAYFWVRQRPSHAVPIASGSWRQRRIEKAAGRLSGRGSSALADPRARAAVGRATVGSFAPRIRPE